MRHLYLLLVALLLAFLPVGCGGDDSQTAAPAETVSSATSTPWTGETIPLGTYAKTVTVADARTVGIADEEFLANNFGGDGKATLTYKFADDRWTHFVTRDDGAPEPGDGGPMKYDEQGNAVLTSESEGCGGCVYIYDWQFDGHKLTMTIVGHESSDGPEDLVVVRFVTEGVYTRQS